MTRPTPTSNPVLHGRYRIEQKLGTGRLAVVYGAYDERLQRPVLVHMFRRELLANQALRDRFVQEAHLSARRSHQSLLEVYDSGEVAGRPYMITEYAVGPTLRDLGALSLEEALLYARQVIGAVAACQAVGAPHPPITSTNLVLVAEGHVELIESWSTPPAEIARDLAAYRAPERTEGHPASAASAVYSLGLLLLEMLAGRRIFDGDDPRAIAQAHLHTRIPSLRELRPTLYAPDLEQLLLRTTARLPEQRPPDAAALGDALDAIRRTSNSATQPLPAPPVRPPSVRERISRTASRVITPAPTPLQPESSAAPDPARPVVRRRSLTGAALVLGMFAVAACFAYYLATLAIDRLIDVELPRPELPAIELPAAGIQLPDWLTGVVGGGGEVLVVDGVPVEGLNLRAGPGLEHQVVALLPNGTQARMIDGPVTADNIPWVRVRTRVGDQELEGWVSANFVKTLSGERLANPAP